MRIAICDDMGCVVDFLLSRISYFLSENDVQADVEGYTSGKKFLDRLQERRFDCVFLDIEMPEYSGYQIAEEIRKIDKGCCIVMATAQVMDYKPAFALGVLRFITKPFSDEEIFEALDALLERKTDSKTVEVYHRRLRYDVPIRKIEYVRAINSEVEIVTQERIYRKEVSLREFESEINSDSFFRCHKSYLININNAKMCKNQIMFGDKVIPVSRRSVKAVDNV